MKLVFVNNTGRKLLLGVILLVLSLFVPLDSQAQTSEEKIISFDTHVQVQTDGTLFVRERILYHFGSNERHGIYREIPKTYTTPASDGNKEEYKLILQNFEVQSSTASTNLSLEHTSTNYRFRIGDPDSTIRGSQVYVLSYEIENAISFYEDFDEVYWNATGNEWSVPITRASLTIELPDQLELGQDRYACYKGLESGRKACDTSALLETRDGVRFTSLNLSPFEGLTGALGFQKGLVPEIERERTGAPRWFSLFLLGLLLGAWFFILIHAFKNWKRTREPSQTKIAVRQYDPPSNMSPSAVGYIVDKRVDNHDITAEIVYLAEKGFIHILSLPKKTFFITKPHFYLLKMNHTSEDLKEYQKLILSSLFSSLYTLSEDERNKLLHTIRESKNLTIDREKLSLKVSSSHEITALHDLKSKFHVDLEKVKKSLENFMASEGYVEKFPYKPSVVYFLSSVAIILLTTLVISFNAGTLLHPGGTTAGIVAFLTIFMLVLVGSLAFPLLRRTQQGVGSKQHALGLKEYLSIAEKERLDFHFNPKKNPHLFEALLPFAIALQVDTQWAKGLEDLFVEPDWYTDAGHAHLNIASLHSSFRSFNSVAASSYSAPSSSGSSGGGFSGGGGGGGGGGSW